MIFHVKFGIICNYTFITFEMPRVNTKDPFEKFTFCAIPPIYNLHQMFLKFSCSIWISTNLTRKFNEKTGR